MFKKFKQAVQAKLDYLIKHSVALFEVDIDKDYFWELYLDSFPEGTNDIFRERREHDCSSCRRFVKQYGNIVGIIDGKTVSIWDVKTIEPYQQVTDVLNKYIVQRPISNPFFSKFKCLGNDCDHEIINDKSHRWEHFYYELPAQFVAGTESAESKKGTIRSTYDVIARSFNELTPSALDTVLDLIAENNLYRGEEHRSAISSFKKLQLEWIKCKDQQSKDNYTWVTAIAQGRFAAIRNTAVGTLLVNLSDGMDLEDAVAKYEHVVAPTNYKRPKALFTKAMLKAAEKKVKSLGLEKSLARRHAKLEDIKVSDVIWASGDSKKVMKSIFEQMADDLPENINAYKGVSGIGIDEFISSILPDAEKVEMLVENAHRNNFVSLVAPVDPTAPSMFKWDNGFSWSYAGGVADSLRDAVIKAGGRVGAFRFSHSWNEIEPNQSLMDLHVFMPGWFCKTHERNPNGSHNTYGNNHRIGWNRRTHSGSGGSQDVDYTSPAPAGYVPVENITFPDISRMPEGKYICKIHNWNFRSSGGRGKAEIECGGNIYQYEYPATTHHKWITIAEVTLKDGKFTIEHKIPCGSSSEEFWGVKTQKFIPVTTVMHSPNHWKGERGIGNRHYFFMLDECINEEEKPRGFYNEFLREELNEHRKTFEGLSSRMVVQPNDQRTQLSGLGFSSTMKNNVTVRVNDSLILKIDFTNGTVYHSTSKKVSV